MFPPRPSLIASTPSNQTQAPIGIVEGSSGVFYAQASGVEIYSVTKAGVVSIAASFADPPYNVESAPGSVGANGRLYSSIETTENAGAGTVFSVTPRADSQLLYSSSSYAPTFSGTLPSGNLFGSAYIFPTYSWALATSTLAGIVTPFYQFPSTDRPFLPIRGADGNFYGTAQIQEGTAYFYRVTPAGVLTKIATLPNVITAYVGNGVVLQGSDGNLYGMTEYNNLLFRLSKSGEYTALYRASSSSQGICSCTLVQGSDGLLYGTALGGGANGGYGAIFSFDAGLPVPHPNAIEFLPASGTVGSRVRIWGYNLLRPSVEFNGVPATGVQSAGPNYVWATVPAGATTGPITVTTPGGSSTTQETFTVQ